MDRRCRWRRHKDRDRGAGARDEAHNHSDADRAVVERGDDLSERKGAEGSAEGDVGEKVATAYSSKIRFISPIRDSNDTRPAA
jgi:hypothetical protein